MPKQSCSQDCSDCCEWVLAKGNPKTTDWMVARGTTAQHPPDKLPCHDHHHGPFHPDCTWHICNCDRHLLPTQRICDLCIGHGNLLQNLLCPTNFRMGCSLCGHGSNQTA